MVEARSQPRINTAATVNIKPPVLINLHEVDFMHTLATGAIGCNIS
jgi:hypothetical protein